jgi:hypothetical protein
MSCSNNLKQLIIAAHHYHDANREFPPAAMRMSKSTDHSIGLHVLLLPYLEEGNIASRIGREINVSKIEELLKTVDITVYWCPSRPRSQQEDYTDASHFTSTYAGVMGSNRPGRTWVLESSHCGNVAIDGVFLPYKSISTRSMTDGTTHTLALGERTYQLRSHFRGAFFLGNSNFVVGEAANKPTKVCVDHAKNMTYGIARPEDAGHYVLAQSAPAGAPKSVLFNDLYYGSEHPSGCHFAFVGGSIDFFSNDMDLTLLKDLSTRNGGE